MSGWLPVSPCATIKTMRVHNFGAGPCTLPLSVLKEVQAEILDYAGTGMSVIELSHRSDEYQSVHLDALTTIRRVAAAPEDFEILFVQGGATLQFAMIPLNLLTPGDRAGYVVSGQWGKRAREDAQPHGDVYPAWDGKADSYRRMPAPDEITVEQGTRYLHVTTNETIGGIRMVEWPTGETPLVADMSSEYLARPIDWDRYDLVYGGVQKNLAPAGMAVIFVRRSALETQPSLGGALRYDWYASDQSLANTPPMFPIYVMGKVLHWLEDKGGIPALEAESAQKASLIYEVIDGSDGYYQSPVETACRSHMNVVWTMAEPADEKSFLVEAEQAGMIGLKGHRSVGGCRASLYAALEVESAARLAGFMADFASARR